MEDLKIKHIREFGYLIIGLWKRQWNSKVRKIITKKAKESLIAQIGQISQVPFD